MSERKRPVYRPGWTNPPRPGDRAAPLEPVERGDQRLAQALAADRADAGFREAENCPECLAQRQTTADPEALCDEHLGRVLGIHGGWALGAPGRKIV